MAGASLALMLVGFGFVIGQRQMTQETRTASAYVQVKELTHNAETGLRRSDDPSTDAARYRGASGGSDISRQTEAQSPVQEQKSSRTVESSSGSTRQKTEKESSPAASAAKGKARVKREKTSSTRRNRIGDTSTASSPRRSRISRSEREEDTRERKPSRTIPRTTPTAASKESSSWDRSARSRRKQASAFPREENPTQKPTSTRRAGRSEEGASDESGSVNTPDRSPASDSTKASGRNAWERFERLRTRSVP